MSMRSIIAGLFVVLHAGFAMPAAAQSIPDPAAGPPVVATAPTLPVAGVGGINNEAQPPASTATYFPILPFGADENAVPQLLPVGSNHPLTENHANVTRAIIVIHDVSRDAAGVLSTLTALAGSANENTLILAPQFLLESDIAHFADRLPNGGRGIARWGWGAWEDGGDSTALPAQKGISSFTAIDLLLLYFGDKDFFPAMKDIVIAGHGAGADFALRYAAAGQAPDLLEAQGLSVRFAAANPSSFLYFTPMRPIPGKPGFALPDASHCAAYDAYPYGVDKLGDYAGRTGSNEIRLRYPSRRVTYLVGEKAGVDDRFPDQGCAAMFEGPDRFARARNYDVYLPTIFGDDVGKTQSFAVVPGAGYDAAGLFGSRCGMSALYGDGACAPAAITSAGIPQ